MTAPELCSRLGINNDTLTAWISEGLPFSGSKRRPRFDPEVVTFWLLTNGKARRDTQAVEQSVLRTVVDVAKHYSVSEKTVRQWLARGMPGEPGPRGRQEGFFSLVEMDDWLERQRVQHTLPRDESHAIEQAKLARTRRQILELELAEKTAKLVDADDVARRWVRFSNEAKAQLEQLPAIVVKLLPDKLPAGARQQVRARIKRQLARVYATLELTLVKQAEELTAEQTNDEPTE